MKLLLPLVFLWLITGFTAGAQRPGGSLQAKAKPKPTVVKAPVKTIEEREPPVTDTFAYNIKKTLDKLSLFILDPDKPVELLMASFAGTPNRGQPEYHSTISFPGAVDNLLTRINVYRNEKKIMWEWHATLVRVPKSEMSKQVLTDLRQRIDGIVKDIHYNNTDEKNKIDELSGYDNTDWTVKEYDIVELTVYFTKPGAIQTEEKTIDSIKALYMPGFAKIETASDAGGKFAQALLAEGFSDEKAAEIVAPELKKVADRDIKIAYEMATSMTLDLKYNAMAAQLSDNQREQMRKIAQAYLDAYKDGRPFNIKTFDPNPPPPPVYSTYTAPAYTPVNPNLYPKSEPAGEKVRCGVCSGTGEMDVLDYSHTYTGIYNNITTQRWHKARCTFCGGSGWVIKHKK